VKPVNAETADSPDDRRATTLEEALVLLLAGAVTGEAWLDAQAGPGLDRAVVATVLAGLAVEAWAPSAPRTSGAARRRFASFALVAMALLFTSSELARGALLGLAALVSLGAIARAVRDRLALAAPVAPRAGPRLRRALAVALGIAVSANVLLLTAGRLLVSERRVDLAAAAPRHLEGHAALALFSRFSFAFVPEEATLLEDGKPLPLRVDWAERVATLGHGRYAVLGGRIVHFSSTDGTDPLANGRRYELVFTPELHRSLFSRALFVLAGLLLFAAWSAGVRLDRPSPRAKRVALATITLAALAVGLPRGWDEIAISRDSGSYVAHSPQRPFLYPAFLDLFDRSPGAPAPELVPEPEGVSCHEEPGHRFISAVRAQKIVAVLAITLLVWVLSGTFEVWALALLVQAAVFADLDTPGDRAVSENVRTLLSEGLNHSLVFLAIAALFSYLRRPRWVEGLAVSAITALLLLARAANTTFVVAFFVIWLFHLERDGLKKATWRAAALGAVCAVPVLLACAHRASTSGAFRLHAGTGMQVFGAAFEAATPDDVDALEDPTEREFLRMCFAEHPGVRVDYREVANYIDPNIYSIGLPSAYKVLATLPQERGRDLAYAADDLFLRTGKHLLARHPVAFARLVLYELGKLFRPAKDLPALACFVVAVVLYRRTRSWLLLFGAFLLLVPWIAMLPSCLFSFPAARYASQLAFADFAAVPLFAIALATPGGGLVPERSVLPSSSCAGS
jgi:hypothetical protein